MMKKAQASILCAPLLAAALFLLSPWAAGAFDKGNVHPKIESVLTRLEDSYAGGAERAQSFARERRIQGIEGNRVTVFILSEGDPAAILDGLRADGAEVVKSAGQVVKARIPLDRIRRIADSVPGVSYISLPGRIRTHAVTSEGVALIKASEYHAAGVNGSGVKIAVIDAGFAGLSAAISSGDLPSGAVRVDCTGTSCVSSSTTFDTGETENHGTAVAEIVQDMAPGAELHLVKISDWVDLVGAKDYCIANGIRIINESAGYSFANFLDGACYSQYATPVCTTNDAEAHGILWVNSAGNSAQRHHGATFTDSGGDGYHDTDIQVAVDANDVIDVDLTWDAWLYTNQDYDLYLLDGNGDVVVYSANVQNGSQVPYEGLTYTATAAGTYTLRIRKGTGASNLRFSLISNNHNILPYVSSTSISTPADAASVLAVGAIDQVDWTTGPVESFSSQGPTADGRIKPDISGPDYVSTTTKGANGFGGTSAASPHVAGAAALLLSRDPSLTVSELRSILEASAIDMGTSGKDSTYGAGRLNLQSSPGAPGLVTPADGATEVSVPVTFTWNKATDPDGDPLTYRLYVDTDNTFASTVPIDVAAASAPAARAASGENGALPFLAFGIAAAIGASRRRVGKALLLAAALAFAAGFSSCNGGDESGGGIFGLEPVLTVSATVSNLQPGTAYYWKVTADDGRGGTTDSATFRFTTAP